MARGSPYSLAYFQTFSVCTCTPATASTTMTAALAARSPALASATKSPYPGVSIRLRRWPFQSQKATEVPSEILRLISSGSKSVVVVPSSTLPSRLTAPAAKRMPSTRDVLPTPPCPAKPTLRILEMSVAMPASPRPHRVGKLPLQEKGRCERGCYHSVTECSSGHWVNLLRHTSLRAGRQALNVHSTQPSPRAAPSARTATRERAGSPRRTWPFELRGGAP